MSCGQTKRTHLEEIARRVENRREKKRTMLQFVDKQRGSSWTRQRLLLAHLNTEHRLLVPIESFAPSN